MEDVTDTAQTENAADGYEPSVVVLYCQRGLADGAVPPDRPGGTAGSKVRLKMVPCSSKVEVWHLLKLIEEGADGVELVCCPEEACQFLVGNDRAERRVARCAALLDSVGMGGGRVGLSRGAGLSEEDLLARAKGRAELVRPIGPNPMNKE